MQSAKRSALKRKTTGFSLTRTDFRTSFRRKCQPIEITLTVNPAYRYKGAT